MTLSAKSKSRLNTTGDLDSEKKVTMLFFFTVWEEQWGNMRYGH